MDAALAHDLGGVLAGQPVGPRRIAVDDRRDQPVMLVDELLRQVIVIGGVVEAEKPSPLVEEDYLPNIDRLLDALDRTFGF